MQCQNHLKQIALAAHIHSDCHDRFPSGTVRESAPAPDDRLSLFVTLLPYVEASHLAAQVDKKQGWQASANQPVVTLAYRIYRCPSDPRTDPEHANIANYVGVAGAGGDAATLGAKHPRAGVFGYDRETAPKDIEDGKSNTLLFLETVSETGPWAAGGHRTVRGIEANDEAPVASKGAFGIVHGGTSWNWGRIQVLANAAMVDGSVRRLTPKISGDVLAALATIAGGEEPPNAW